MSKLQDKIIGIFETKPLSINEYLMVLDILNINNINLVDEFNQMTYENKILMTKQFYNFIDIPLIDEYSRSKGVEYI